MQQQQCEVPSRVLLRSGIVTLVGFLQKASGSLMRSSFMKGHGRQHVCASVHLRRLSHSGAPPLLISTGGTVLCAGAARASYHRHVMLSCLNSVGAEVQRKLTAPLRAPGENAKEVCIINGMHQTEHGVISNNTWVAAS